MHKRHISGIQRTHAYTSTNEVSCVSRPLGCVNNSCVHFFHTTLILNIKQLHTEMPSKRNSDNSSFFLFQSRCGLAHVFHCLKPLIGTSTLPELVVVIIPSSHLSVCYLAMITKGAVFVLSHGSIFRYTAPLLCLTCEISTSS